MYERFTDRARKVMALANYEAQRFNHEYIGTEHVLLGLVGEGSGVAANVLKNLDVDLRKVRLEVEKLVESRPDMTAPGKLPQSRRAKKVIENSMKEARNLNHNYVGTEHILLGLLQEKDTIAAQVLMSLGLNLERVRQEILSLLGHGPASPAKNVLPISQRDDTIRAPASLLRAYDLFSDHARNVIEFADDEARQFNHDHVGTVHLLLGLIREEGGMAAQALKNLDLDLQQVRLDVEQLVPRGPDVPTKSDLPPTSRAQAVIQYALQEARALNRPYAGTEHILLGLTRERDEVSAQVLLARGVTLERLREEVIKLVSRRRERLPWLNARERRTFLTGVLVGILFSVIAAAIAWSLFSAIRR